MSVILEVYYRAPVDEARERRIVAEVGTFGGVLGFREEPTSEVSRAVCLTLEFASREMADKAAAVLRAMGEHVDGPSDYE